MNQLATISPIFCQLIASTPNATIPKPVTAPTIECVVDTGIPNELAMCNQIAAAKSEQDMPIASLKAAGESCLGRPLAAVVFVSGLSAEVAGSAACSAGFLFEAMPTAVGRTIPLRMVSVTWAPTRTAPRNSQIAAAITAFRTVSDLEPTAAAIELATSLAPMFQAM